MGIEAKKSGMVQVRLELYKPFYDFLENFQVFNGSSESVQDLCQQIIYEHVRDVFEQVKGFLATGFPQNIHSQYPWARKWEAIAQTTGLISSE